MKELLVLFWTDSVVNSSENYYQKSKFLQAWVFKFHANVQARSSAVWFLKQSKQMRLPQSSQAILHHVSLFRFRQCLQWPLENFMGQCPPSRRPELANNRCAEKFLISNCKRSKRKASWVLDRWCGDSFSKIYAFTIATSTRNHVRQRHHFLDFLPAI